MALPNGVHVVIVEPGDLRGCTGQIIGTSWSMGRRYTIQLDYEMEDSETGRILRRVTIEAMWIEEMAERSIGQ